MNKEKNKYWKILKEARKQNNRLGFGNNEKNWQREVYENQRRDLLHEKRTATNNSQSPRANILNTEEKEKFSSVLSMENSMTWEEMKKKADKIW